MKVPKTKKGALRLLDKIMKDVEWNVCPTNVPFINEKLETLRKAIEKGLKCTE